MQAAQTPVDKGVWPWDHRHSIAEAIWPVHDREIGEKTHRVLIVVESMRTGGFGDSLKVAIVDNFGDYLDAPVISLSSQDVPTPHAGTPEEWTVVKPSQIVTAVEQLCKLWGWILKLWLGMLIYDINIFVFWFGVAWFL